MRIEMEGVREYADEMPVALGERDGRLVIDAPTEGGYAGTEVDLLDLIAWLRANRPDLLEAPK